MYLAKIKKVFLDLLDRFGLAYWVKIITINPMCTYSIGSFLTKKEAQLALTICFDELRQDKSEVLSIEIKQFNPKKLENFDSDYQKISLPFSTDCRI